MKSRITFSQHLQEDFYVYHACALNLSIDRDLHIFLTYPAKKIPAS